MDLQVEAVLAGDPVTLADLRNLRCEFLNPTRLATHRLDANYRRQRVAESIEFIGPIALAAIGARVGRNFAAIAVAAAGVYLLTHVRFLGQPVGVGFAMVNAALFALYIVLAHRVARRSAMGGIDGLAAAMMFAFVFVSPIGLRGAVHAFGERWCSLPEWASECPPP
jgi:hypothetical protein